MIGQPESLCAPELHAGTELCVQRKEAVTYVKILITKYLIKQKTPEKNFSYLLKMPSTAWIKIA
jgi:hypothetical protein